MSLLDLDYIIVDWPHREDEVSARLVRGSDNVEFLQLRIEMGVMQMRVDGRPDGERYHGLPTAQAHIRHELKLAGGGVAAHDWQELIREIGQFNYRRIAFGGAADGFLAANDAAEAVRMLSGAISDIDFCLASTEMLSDHRGEAVLLDDESLEPTLLFNRGRHAVQRLVAMNRNEAAIDAADDAIAALNDFLAARGVEADERESDPGITHLRVISQRLRSDLGITKTLRERMDEAIAAEDFAEAARLRDEMRIRDGEVEGEGGEG